MGRLFTFICVLSLVFQTKTELFGCANALEELERGGQSALEVVEDGALMAQILLSSNTKLSTAPTVNGDPLHLVSSLEFPQIWITNPEVGADYVVVKKLDEGWGFGSARTNRFTLIDDPKVNLRSLDLLGVGGPFFLATFIVDTDAGKSLVFKAAKIKDSDTGELELVSQVAGLSVDGVKDFADKFVVSPRPGTAEFWITDASRKIRSVVVDTETVALRVEEVFEVDEEIEVEGQKYKVTEVLKLEFFEDEMSGYVKFMTESGQTMIAPFSIEETPVEPEQESETIQTLFGEIPAEEPSKAMAEDLEAESEESLLLDEIAEEEDIEIEEEFKIHFDKSLPLAEGSLRSTVVRSMNLVFVSYADRVDVYRMDETDSRMLKSLDLKEFAAGYEILGIESFIDSKFEVYTDDEGQTHKNIYDLTTKAVLLLKDEEGEVKLVWLDLGIQPASTGGLAGQ